eukprot:COSAG01_NODE_1200_length_11277_cov_59.330739_5_plen_304_part_00
MVCGRLPSNGPSACAAGGCGAWGHRYLARGEGAPEGVPPLRRREDRAAERRGEGGVMGNLCCKGKRDLEAQRERVRRRLELQTLDQRERAIFDKVRAREERIAATLLQALCRGALNCPAIGRHQWMHQGPPDGSRYRLLGVKRKINRAAEVLGQQLMLGYAVRCRFEKAIYSAMSIERVWRGHKVRQRLRFLNAMALKIQTCWRGWHWRRWLKEMKANMAASALQHAARCNMAKRELEHRRRFRAALTIQWWWRRRAKMRIWMAIRYEKAARRIQGGACSGFHLLHVRNGVGRGAAGCADVRR